MKKLIVSVFAIFLCASIFAQHHSETLEKHRYLPLNQRTSHQLNGLTIGNYARVKVSKISTNNIDSWLSKGVAIDHLHWLDEAQTAFVSELSHDDIALIQANSTAMVEVLVDDLEYHYAHQNDNLPKNNGFNTVTSLPVGFRLGSMGGYLTFNEYVTLLDSLTIRYPNLVSPKFSIGTTVEGRNIWAIKISDNVAVNEPEPEVLIDGLIHAREGVAGMQSLYFVCDLLEKYTQNDMEARFLVNNRELFVVPVINPDGYEYNRSIAPNGGGMWRKNRKDNGDGTFGVDLNRNFGYFWGIDNSGSSPNSASDLFRGTSGFSELETQAMRNFANTRQFKTALNHHTFSNLMIRPFAYNEQVLCPDEQTFVEYGPVLTEQNGFLYGKASETVGYNVNGSTDDWLYGEANTKPRIISFTPETGGANDGFWPPLNRIVPLCQTVEDANFKIVWLAGEYFQAEADPHTVYQTIGYIPFYLRNIGQSSSLPVSVRFVSNSSYVLSTPAKAYATVGSFVRINDSVSVTLAPNTPNNTLITGDIHATFGEYTYIMGADFVYKTPIAVENNLTSANISFFPNPAQHFLNMKSDIAVEQIIICDIVGKTVSSHHIKSDNAVIDIKTLPQGVYILDLYAADGVKIGATKFVKE